MKLQLPVFLKNVALFSNFLKFSLEFIYPGVCTDLEDRFLASVLLFPTFSESCNRFDRFFYVEICKELNFFNFVIFVINIIYVHKFFILTFPAA